MRVLRVLDRATDIASILQSSLFGTRETFSGPHVDVLGGVLTGFKAWPILPEPTLEELKEFKDEGDSWQPAPGQLRLIVTEDWCIELYFVVSICQPGDNRDWISLARLNAMQTALTCLFTDAVLATNLNGLTYLTGPDMIV